MYTKEHAQAHNIIVSSIHLELPSHCLCLTIQMTGNFKHAIIAHCILGISVENLPSQSHFCVVPHRTMVLHILLLKTFITWICC